MRAPPASLRPVCWAGPGWRLRDGGGGAGGGNLLLSEVGGERGEPWASASPTQPHFTDGDTETPRPEDVPGWRLEMGVCCGHPGFNTSLPRISGEL